MGQLTARFISISMRVLGILALAACWLPALPPSARAFDIIQVTNNGSDDRIPDVSGSNLEWWSCDGPADPGTYCANGDWEIYFSDGVTTTRITNNGTDDYSPDLSGSKVVWQGWDGHDYEIYLWDGVSTTQITNDGFHDRNPAISGSNVVWERMVDGDWELFFWDGVSTTQITNNDFHDRSPAISGSNVVWFASQGGPEEIFFWDGVTTTQLTSGGGWDPDISGSNVVWAAWDGDDYQIFFWDGVTTTQLTSGGGSAPAISGSNVVWAGGGIWLWDGVKTTQIADGVVSAPDISGSKVVWEGWDGNDYEIYMTTITESVEIDIQPCRDWNLIYPFSRLLVPVALLGSDEFDVSDADVTALAFGPDGASPAFDLTNPFVYWLSHRDVNQDGRKDLLSYYRTEDTGIAMGETQACLTGETLEGTPIQGCDAITTLLGCGHGFEAALVAPPLVWIGGRKRRRRR